MKYLLIPSVSYDLKKAGNKWHRHTVDSSDFQILSGFFNHRTVAVPFESKYKELAGKIVLYGGLNFEYRPMSEVYFFSVSESQVEIDQLTVSSVSGKPPPPRHSHSMKFMDLFGGFIIHGGKGPNEEVLNDMWIFCFPTRDWKKVVPKIKLESRCNHEVNLIYCRWQLNTTKFTFLEDTMIEAFSLANFSR